MALNIPSELIVKRFGLTQAGKVLSQYGRRCLILAGAHFWKSDDSEFFTSSLTLRGMDYDEELYPGGEPEVSYVDKLVSKYKDKKRYRPLVDFVVGIGGGSVIDAAKAAAGLLTNEGSAESYLEMPGMLTMKNKPLPFVAIPTTAGTGAEATKNAVLKNSDKKIKKSFRDDRLTARCVIIDEALYIGASKEATAYAGADALAQLIESFTGKKAGAETDEYCRRGLKRLSDFLLEAYDDGENFKARGETALAAYESGVAISNSSVGAVHALASPIGAYTGLPHGLVCGILLPNVMALNKKSALKKFAELGGILSGKDGSEEQMADMAVSAVQTILRDMNIPTSFKSDELMPFISNVVDDCIDGASMKANASDYDACFWKDFMLKMCK